MDAICAKVETANKLDDPLASFPAFKKYDRNGMNILIECKRVADLDPSTVNWAVELTKANMQTIYEVQLESRVKRKGLGKFLMQILQLLANSTQMKKVMLTVFKHNRGAYQFFREAMQFDIDESSPSVSGCCGDDCSYEILSRRTKYGEHPHPHGSPHCGGCCH
ncbi:N-alpha-acetyltransferase 40 isoform X2 [Heterodontus francisci]|uniref:N-alpha-acetyltransferase 40 isoform X2 n=1 Tax=Heterodontus francisci TaxID=7792 RepID=UPI00355C2924